ncbi:hypothetical protein VKI21_12475 [Cyanobacterium aponinum UTEX 3222]|uniref:hypothetical protein n=1 Tax=Cyanobacterium aponinum TaxID=379064 RepID=UPI003088ABAC|nr:hypothetical protein VKI21_12475 [Cyanobacterium aponinum UTEX 3222]
MTIQKGLLPIGNNFNLKSFTEEGGYIHRKPIPEIQPFSAIGVIANKEYIWDFSNLQTDVIPYTLFGYKSTGINNNDSLIVQVKQASNNQLIWELELAGNKDVYGNAFAFVFPFLVVSRLHKASIKSSVALDSFTVFAEKAFLNPSIAPDTLV